jgi:hypothetical protein
LLGTRVGCCVQYASVYWILNHLPNTAPTP